MVASSLRGIVLALTAALCFGVTLPFVDAISGDLGHFTIAALLYSGSALAALLGSAAQGTEPPMQLKHVPRLVVVAVLGAAVAPALVMYAVHSANVASVCLLMNFEVVFTAAFGVFIYREPLGWRLALGVVVITVGAALLVWDPADVRPSALAGLGAAILGAACQSIDNGLSRPLADLQASEVVFTKSVVGSLLTASVALVIDPAPTQLAVVLGLVGLGMVGFGATEWLYLLAQRRLGVARTGSVFAVAPFFGTATAMVLGAEVGLLVVGAGLLMAAGVFMLATEHDPEPRAVMEARRRHGVPTTPAASARQFRP